MTQQPVLGWELVAAAALPERTPPRGTPPQETLPQEMLPQELLPQEMLPVRLPRFYSGFDLESDLVRWQSSKPYCAANQLRSRARRTR